GDAAAADRGDRRRRRRAASPRGARRPPAADPSRAVGAAGGVRRPSRGRARRAAGGAGRHGRRRRSGRGARRRHARRSRGRRVRGLVALLPWLVAGCPGGSGKAAPTAEAQTTADDPAIHLAHVLIELQDDILASYERDEPPELDSSMIVPAIGTARIGAGPGDVYIAGDLARAPSRWPLDVDRSMRTDVRSKNLSIQVAADQTAAWMSDELSWRIETCGRTAVIPLRITALYAHDGDRWIPVFEHLSFGWAPTPLDAPPPKAIKTEVVSGDLRDELSGVLGRGLLRTPHD